MTALAAPREQPKLSHLQGSLLVLFTGVIFSFGGLAFRSTTNIGAWEYVFYRGAGAAAVAAAWLLLHHRSRLPHIARDVQPMHLLAGLLLGTISCLFIVAFEIVSVDFVLFLQTLAPITAAYFSWLIMRERVSRNVVIATVGTMIGMGVMVSGTLTDAIEPAGFIALAIPAIFGLYATLIRSANKIDPTVPVLVSGLTMVTVGLVVSLASGGLIASGADAAIGFMAGSVLLGAPLVLFNQAQRVVPSSETSLLLLSEVVLAPLWVWVFVSEQPEATTLIGGSMILATVAWLTVVRAPRRGRVITSRG